MGTKSVSSSTLAGETPPTTGPPGNISSGIASSAEAQTSSLFFSVSAFAPSSPVITTSFFKGVASKRISRRGTDPLSRLSPPAIGGIVFACTLLTVICLAASFMLFRRKAQRPASKISEVENTPTLEIKTAFESQTTLHVQTTPGTNTIRTNKARPSEFIYPTSTSSLDRITPPSLADNATECLIRMTYIDQTSTSPPSSIAVGRGSLSLANWQPHDGRRPPLRLSSDTCLVLDPFLREVSLSLPTEPQIPSLPSNTR
ncbi:uncharacterized protein VP01_1253g3 [Puccinia sorghi]|uniref:Uncharacterized protein n=1 Tax=Puccinia sorghi TaxID=27349 RepID=A0A0L6VPC0_9BASI|nr:uncharacterized protein VP01_1253g3 [Puccinia sorghi]